MSIIHVRIDKSAFVRESVTRSGPLETLVRRAPSGSPRNQSVLKGQYISLDARARLMNLYLQLNPAELQRQIIQKTARLLKISR